MRAFITSEEHFISRGPDIYCPTVYGYPFWERYLQIFDEVVVIARIKSVGTLPSEARRADGKGVRFLPLPDYTGPWQYLLHQPLLKVKAREAARQEGAFILRLPGTAGTLLWHYLKQLGKPFAAEVVGDPAESLNYRSLRTPWSLVIRRIAIRQLKSQCRGAAAAAYVTQKVLQNRYPPGGYSVACSDVILGPEAILNEEVRVSGLDSRARERFPVHPARLCFVGSLARLYKAPDVLIEAVAICRRKGVNLRLNIVGEGKYRPLLEEKVRSLGLGEHVLFLGQLPGGAAVREQLDASDLFILPSRVEGLPRALIEAMARGLPCIGSRVGGIPELLPEEDLVPPGRANDLSQKIVEVLTSPGRLPLMSSRNLTKAKEFREDLLREKFVGFYRLVKEKAETWGRQTVQ